MSDEWIVQFGGVFVELQKIREKSIRKQKSADWSNLPKTSMQKPSLKITSYYRKNKTHDQHL